MKWSKEAEKAVQKVPFFVRKKVKSRVEKEARNTGKQIVGIEDVKATKRRYLNRMEDEVKGFQFDACFGTGGCPNRALESSHLFLRIEKLLIDSDMKNFLKRKVDGELKFHHEFRVSISDCPNACSQPQIKDIGILGAKLPGITENECSHCLECLRVCKENAISLSDSDKSPVINIDLCVKCGLCIPSCPTGTIQTDQQGFRIQVGGKLGRHPKLGRELSGLYDESQTIALVKDCIDFYKNNCQNGERFGELVEKNRSFISSLNKKHPV